MQGSRVRSRLPLLCAGLLWSLVLERVGYSAVAGAGRLTGNDDADRSGVVVDGLMSLARCDLDSLPWLESEVVMLDLDGEFALEDVEELAGTRVAVAGFAGAWGHEFFDDAEVGGADEVPAVAVVAPGVVLGGGGGDDPCRHQYRV